MGGKGSGGSNRKPAEAKARIGNPGKRALSIAPEPTEVVATGSPEPHRPLGKAGRELWDRLWVAGAGWLRVSSDAEAVLLVCEAIDERQALRFRVMSDPDLWRERKALRELERQISAGLGELGMNPVDRGRLNIGEVKENEFAKLHAKIAARRAASAS